LPKNVFAKFCSSCFTSSIRHRERPGIALCRAIYLLIIIPLAPSVCNICFHLTEEQDYKALIEVHVCAARHGAGSGAVLWHTAARRIRRAFSTCPDELPFGHIKHNLRVDGFLLRGLDGVIPIRQPSVFDCPQRDEERIW
jgi:hypothetical protein